MRYKIIETDWKTMCGKCRKNYVNSIIQEVINKIDLANHKRGISYFARKYGIPRTTLHDALTKRGVKTNGRFKGKVKK